MTNDSSQKPGKLYRNALTIIVSIIVGVAITILGVYFTDYFFKPQVLYTVTGFKVKLPDIYEKEIARIRAKVFAENLKEVLEETSEEYLEGEAVLENYKVLMRPKGINIAGPKRDSVEVYGEDIDKMFDMLEDPKLLKSFLDSTELYPTAFATITIENSGNRAATDMDLAIYPNGIVVEETFDSSEPSIKAIHQLIDKATGVQTGIQFPTIKRLSPGGYLTVEMYWHILDDSEDELDTPTVTVKGTFKEGTVQYAEARPSRDKNYFLLILGIAGLSLLGGFLGLLIEFLSRNIRSSG